MRIIMSILAIFLPWLVLLLHDNPGGAIVALIMQASMIGWPFASAWAFRTIKENKKPANQKSTHQKR
ncbi:MAG: hypothetical protein CK426_00275 [Legionella sp.]|nr:MAG: hypothetical protein CK423_06355 [Legionella sp.]PJE00189.1 MAG: hypothetical protein CK426_00275 [Legionella sp.]